MSRPAYWVCLLLVLALPATRCQKKELDTNVSEQQQSIDEVERREGKPQDSGNGKDAQLDGFYDGLFMQTARFDVCGFS